MPTEELARMKQRRDNTAVWVAYNDVLLDGEFGVERTSGDRTLVKVGDGSAQWTSLPYLGAVNYSDADDNELILKSALNQALSLVAPMALASVDYTTIAQHSLFIVPTGYRAIIRDIVVTTDSITTASDMPFIQLGTSANNDEILAPIQLSSIMNQANETEMWEGTLSKVYSAGEEIQFGISTAGASSSHTGTVIIAVMFI